VQRFLVVAIALLGGACVLGAQGATDSPADGAPGDGGESSSSLNPGNGGPEALSRDSVMGPMASHKGLRIRPFAGVMGVYDSQLTDVTLTPNGKVPEVGAYGVEAEGGLLGYKAYRHGIVGINYRGDYRNYVNGHFFNGMDHLLAVDLRHQISKHLTLALQESLGSYARSFSGPAVGGFVNPILVNNPAADIFDGRTNYMSTRGDVTVELSPRLSVDLGGMGFVVRRKAPILAGVNGYDAHADTLYRVTRHATIGGYYRFTHYDFPNAFGAADVHSTGTELAYRFNKAWELSVMAGISRLEAQSQTQVRIDPVIAAITGQTEGFIATHRVNYVPDLNARLMRVFRNGSFQVNYSRTVNPGNGIYLTSQYETGGAVYSYTGLHHWNFGFEGGYDRYSSLTQAIGPYRGVRGGFGFTRDLSHNLYLTFRGDYRRYDVNYGFFQRDQSRLTMGVNWSPGDTPLSLW